MQFYNVKWVYNRYTSLGNGLQSLVEFLYGRKARFYLSMSHSVYLKVGQANCKLKQTVHPTTENQKEARDKFLTIGQHFMYKSP